MKKTILRVLMYLGVYLLLQVAFSSILSIGATIYYAATGSVDASQLSSPDTMQQLASIGWVLGLSSLLSNIAAIAVMLYLHWADFSLGRIGKPAAAGVMLTATLIGITQAVPTGYLTEVLQAEDILSDVFSGMMNNVWGILALCVGAPLGEELLFRGAIQRELHKRVRPWIAIGITALLFALIHGNPVQMVAGFLMGCVLGWLYWRTGSVWPGIAMHFANNTLSTVVASIYGQDAKTADIFGQGWQLYALVAALTVATIALLWLFNRKSKEL